MQRLREFVDFEVLGASMDASGKLLMYGATTSVVLDLHNPGARQYQNFTFPAPEEHATAAVLADNSVYYGSDMGKVYRDFSGQCVGAGSEPVSGLFQCNGRVFYAQGTGLHVVDGGGSRRLLDADAPVTTAEFDEQTGLYRFASAREVIWLDTELHRVGQGRGNDPTGRNDVRSPEARKDAHNSLIFTHLGFTLTKTRLALAGETVQTFSYVSCAHWCPELRLLTITDHVPRAVFVYELAG